MPLLREVPDRITPLISGKQLASCMFEHNVGVAPASVYEVKKVDTDFFEED